jgi:hypothetical protein
MADSDMYVDEPSPCGITVLSYLSLIFTIAQQKEGKPINQDQPICTVQAKKHRNDFQAILTLMLVQ